VGDFGGFKTGPTYCTVLYSVVLYEVVYIVHFTVYTVFGVCPAADSPVKLLCKEVVGQLMG
jgi:hypothetical protein